MTVVDVSNIFINRKKYLIDRENILYDYNTHEVIGEYDRKKKVIYELEEDEDDEDEDDENQVVICDGYNNNHNYNINSNILLLK